MVVAVGITIVQLIGGFLVPDVGRNIMKDEERPLLSTSEESEEVLSLKGVLQSQDSIIRRGCESRNASCRRNIMMLM